MSACAPVAGRAGITGHSRVAAECGGIAACPRIVAPSRTAAHSGVAAHSSNARSDVARLSAVALAVLCAALLAWPSSAARADETFYSAASLYNLGNSYARAGRPALAVLNYERAALLAPNDPDIEANLRYVRDSAHQPTESKTSFERLVTTPTPTLVSWLGVLGIALVGTGLLARRLSPAHRWRYRAVTAIGALLVGLTAANAVVLWPSLHSAVVVTAATPVRVSPAPMGDPLFTLPEAETVRIRAEHEDFVLVQTRAGRTGWVERANIVPVQRSSAVTALP